MAQGPSTQSLEVFGRAVLALDKCSRLACGSRESLSRTLPKILIGEGSALVSRPPKSEYDEGTLLPLDACQGGLSRLRVMSSKCLKRITCRITRVRGKEKFLTV